MGALEAAQTAGYRFATMADVDGPDACRNLYELDMECSQDEPGFAPAGFTSYEQWAHHVFAVPLYDPKAVAIALLGEEWAGMSGLHFPIGQDAAVIFFTGVRRAHRGRKLAQALKLLTVQYALERGCTKILTGNNERNPAMLEVNRKFGFQPLPGAYHMEREV
jgi:GNAT superfamily N-acetyltransferase